MSGSDQARIRLSHWHRDIINNLWCIPDHTSIIRCMPQVVHVLHILVEKSLLLYAQHFVVNQIKDGAVWRSQIWRDDCSSLAFKIDHLARPVRGGAVLLNDEELARDLTYGRQPLL